MQKKAVRVALEAVLAVVVLDIAHTVGGTIGEVLTLASAIVVIYAIVDLLRN